MGNPVCDAVSIPEGFFCERPLGHIETKHEGDDVFWTDTPNGRAELCLDIADEPGPLPSRCNRGRDHAGDHESTEHRKVLHTWENR